jgi:hypothetical protein
VFTARYGLNIYTLSITIRTMSYNRNEELWHRCQVRHRLIYRLAPVPSTTPTDISAGTSAKYDTNWYISWHWVITNFATLSSETSQFLNSSHVISSSSTFILSICVVRCEYREDVVIQTNTATRGHYVVLSCLLFGCSLCCCTQDTPTKSWKLANVQQRRSKVEITHCR